MPLTTLPAIRYCTPDDVAAFLGVPFGVSQTPSVVAQIARAEAFIDNECKRTWASGPIVGEAFFSPYGLDPPSFFTNYVAGWVPLGSAVLLKTTPIQSVERVQGVGWLGTPPIVLVRDLDYEVRDLLTGYVRITVPSAYYKIIVDYTPVDAVPPDITQAAIMLTATWLTPMVNPDAFGVDRVQLPDLTVQYSKASNSTAISPEVLQILEPYRFRTTA